MKRSPTETPYQKNLKFDMQTKFIPVNKFEFMRPFEDDSINGLYFNKIYLPEEIIENILSYVPPNNLLQLTLVCKKWCNIVKSENFWMNIYNRRYPGKAKKLPWYVYYCYFTTNNFENLIKNGNGQEQYKYWRIIKNGGDKFRIDDPPIGADPLPLDVPEFEGHTSCFSTSYRNCKKIQIISLKNKRLLQYILNKFTPHIYASEWVAGRFDCGCSYRLAIGGYNENFKIKDLDGANLNPIFCMTVSTNVQQWQGSQWEKVEILAKQYLAGVAVLVFEHEGRDTQFWKGHYGSKMAGGVVRIIFDSIQPLEDKVETGVGEFDENFKMNI